MPGELGRPMLSSQVAQRDDIVSASKAMADPRLEAHGEALASARSSSLFISVAPPRAPGGEPSVTLEAEVAADPRAISGECLQAPAYRHGWRNLSAAGLRTLLAIGSEAGGSAESDISRALRRGAGQSVNDLGQQIVGQSLSLAPTLTIMPRGATAGSTVSRSRAGALSGGTLVTKLKLTTIADDTPVKLTLELPAPVHRDLVAYGQAMASGPDGRAVDPAKLIAPMLSRFIQSDRAFVRRRNLRDV